MNIKKLFLFSGFINVLILLAIIFYSQHETLITLGVILLIVNFIISLKVKTDEANVRKIKIKDFNVEFSGIGALVFGLIGMQSMFKLTDSIDLLWFYFLIFNLVVMANFRINVKHLGV